MSEAEVILPTSQQGIRLLTLDGGGIRGLSELLILKEILERVRVKAGLTETPLPCDYFDLIAGTSTGGLIAIMLGRLRMSVDEAISCYGSLAKRVFSGVKRRSCSGDHKFKATILKNVIREIVKKQCDDPDEGMMDSRTNACRTFVCAMSAHNMDAGIPRLFRTYLAPKSQLPDCKIWEAARATSAAPTFFKRIEIGSPGEAESYIDGGIANNNPIKIALRELELIFSDRSISSIISIGTGHSRTIQIPRPGIRQKIIPIDVIKALQEIANDCEKNAEEIAKRFESSPRVYFRFNVEQGLQDVGLGNWEMLGEVTASTRQYMGHQNIDERMDNAILALQACSAAIPISSLNVITANTPTLLPQAIPPTPKLCIGRDADTTEIVDLILAGKSTAILGGGGMGKTTLALAVLHNEMVTKRFETIYFIDCEGVPTLELLIKRIADALRLPVEQRDGHLLDRLIHDLAKKRAVMCLDNFESLWDLDDSASKVEVERCLEKLTAVPELLVLITMRGHEPPPGVESHIVSPLAQHDASEMFAAISNYSDEYSSKLVHATGGIPLALELLARLLGPGLESSRSLWRRWQQTGTNTASRSADPHRLLSLNASIELSLESPRVRADPTARIALGLLSLLPDGLANPSDVTEELACSLALGHRLVDSLSTLTRTALAYIDTSEPGRYRVLSPISEFVAARRDTFLDSTTMMACTDFFVKFISDRWDYTDSHNLKQVPGELLNIQSALDNALLANHDKLNERVVRASIWHTRWNSYRGTHSAKLLHQLLRGEKLSSALKADCSKCLGEINFKLDRLEDAEMDLQLAAELHQQVRDLVGEGDDRCHLGELYTRIHRLKEAKEELLKAVELHQQACSVVGEGTDRMRLGELYLQLDQPEEAERELLRAVELHQQAQAVLPEAFDRLMLGELYIRLDRAEEAEKQLLRAVELHQQVQSIAGEGSDRTRLGELYMRMDRLKEAETELLQAVKMHQQAQNALTEGSDRALLGELYTRLGRLEEAETELLRAVVLHQQAQSVVGEGTDRMRLGELYLLLDQLEEAEEQSLRAVELHQQAHDVISEGSDRSSLGELYIRLDRLEEAERELLRAIELHQQVQVVLPEASDRLTLGELYMRLDRPKEAETELLRAVMLHQRANSVVGEGSDRTRLGELYMRMDRLKEAETELLQAVKMHQQAQNALTEGSDRALLGELYTRLGRLEEAETELLRALALHQQAHSVVGEGVDRVRLGELYMQLELMEKAECHMLRSIELFKQSQSVLGEGIGRTALGELYTRLGRLSEAETQVSLATELSKKASDGRTEIKASKLLSKVKEMIGAGVGY